MTIDQLCELLVVGGPPGNLWVALGGIADGPGLRMEMAALPGRRRTRILEGCHRHIKQAFGVIGG